MQLFGTAYTTADDIRRNYSRQWNPVYPTELPENLTSAFNWTAYLTFEMAPPQLQNIEMMIFNEVCFDRLEFKTGIYTNVFYFNFII